jgi:hypothetical protein
MCRWQWQPLCSWTSEWKSEGNHIPMLARWSWRCLFCVWLTILWLIQYIYYHLMSVLCLTYNSLQTSSYNNHLILCLLTCHSPEYLVYAETSVQFYKNKNFSKTDGCSPNCIQSMNYFMNDMHNDHYKFGLYIYWYNYLSDLNLYIMTLVSFVWKAYPYYLLCVAYD